MYLQRKGWQKVGLTVQGEHLVGEEEMRETCGRVDGGRRGEDAAAVFD